MADDFLTKLRNVNVRRCNESFGHSFESGKRVQRAPNEEWTGTDWACALAGEVGELCNMIKKERRGEHVSPLDIQDEIADCFIYLDLLAAYYGVSIEDVVRRKFNVVSIKRNSPYQL